MDALRKGAMAIVARLGLVLLVCLTIHLPLAIAVVALVQGQSLVGLLAVVPLFLVSGPATTAALTQHTVLNIGGDRPAFGKAYGNALKNIFHALPTVLVVAGIQALGYALFIVPGIVASVLFSLAIPIAVVERTSVGTALSRSFALVVGARWSMFGALSLIGTLSMLLARLVSLPLGEVGYVVGVLFEAALVATTSAALFVDQIRVHQGVDVESVVRRAGGTFGGAAFALEEDVERALAGVKSTSAPPVAIPISVRDGAVMDFAAARDRKMRALKIGFAVATGVGFVTLGGLGYWSRVEAAREAQKATAARIETLQTAHPSSSVVPETIVLRRDLYGKNSSDIAVVMTQGTESNRRLSVLSLLDAELVSLGCGDAVSSAKRGSSVSFAQECPASPLTAEDAGRVSAEHLAIATVLEARAATAGKSADPEHRALISALLRPF